MKNNTFERRLEQLPANKALAIVAIADTAYLALAWLRDHEIPFTATDVLKMTEMMRAEMKTKPYQPSSSA